MWGGEVHIDGAWSVGPCVGEPGVDAGGIKQGEA